MWCCSQPWHLGLPEHWGCPEAEPPSLCRQHLCPQAQSLFIHPGMGQHFRGFCFLQNINQITALRAGEQTWVLVLRILKAVLGGVFIGASLCHLGLIYPLLSHFTSRGMSHVQPWASLLPKQERSCSSSGVQPVACGSHVAQDDYECGPTQNHKFI